MMLVFYINAIATAGAIFAYLNSYARLLQYLGETYPSIWRELGEPSFSSRRAQDNPFEYAQTHINLLQFVFSNRFTAVQDQGLATLVWWVRVSLCLGILFFLSMISVGFQIRH
jgi:hypothetical protein